MKMDKGSKFGMFLGGIGGIIAIIGLAISFERDVSTFVPLATFLLLAVMFFALCGAFNKTGQWTPRALTVFAFMTGGIALAVSLVGYINLYIGLAEFVIAMLIVIISYSPATKRFVSQCD